MGEFMGLLVFVIGGLAIVIGLILTIFNAIKKRPLKKYGITILVGVVLFIAGPLSIVSTQKVSEKPKEKEEVQEEEEEMAEEELEEEKEMAAEEELEEEEESIKDTAIEADFVEINGKEEADGMRVFAEGEISSVDYDNVMDVLPSFLLSQEEGDGYGMYHITNAISLKGLEDGDIVTIYGLVSGTSDLGIPRIIATIIEPKEAVEEEIVEEKTEYGLDEWWEVEDQWKLKIDSVRFTDERNEFSDKDPEAVVVIKYTYENLGYEGDVQDLFMTPDNVIDGEKKVASTYPAGAKVSPETTPVGAITEGSEKSYGLTSDKGEITIYFDEHDDSINKYKATFVIPLPSE